MVEMIFLFLFCNLLSFFFQIIQTAFFCYDYLLEIYVVEGDNKRKIEHSTEAKGGNWNVPYYFLN